MNERGQNGGRRESEIELGREEDAGGVMEIRGKDTNTWVKKTEPIVTKFIKFNISLCFLQTSVL